ncbi:hypothetical protein evm_007748 [Chilo suppressalis]|nr:hypothetical protein evm_007748 [Chilo suppressalis]
MRKPESAVAVGNVHQSILGLCVLVLTFSIVIIERGCASESDSNVPGSEIPFEQLDEIQTTTPETDHINMLLSPPETTVPSLTDHDDLPNTNSNEIIKENLRKLNGKLHLYNAFKDNIRENFEPVLVDNKNETLADKAVKEKIYNLADYTVNQVKSKVQVLDKLHRLYSGDGMYKIGYLVSYINKTHIDMSKTFKFIEKKKDEWDLLTLVNSYEEMKNTKEMIFDMMSVVNLLVATYLPRSTYLKGKQERFAPKQGIAWSYYDDAS